MFFTNIDLFHESRINSSFKKTLNTTLNYNILINFFIYCEVFNQKDYRKTIHNQ